jgi:hypothetical protein
MHPNRPCMIIDAPLGYKQSSRVYGARLPFSAILRLIA